jgi:glutamate synthase domain-containing protein 1
LPGNEEEVTFVNPYQNLLYRPEFEHDACGVGFVARITGQPGHDILQMALQAVSCMKHRSGIDADGLSGDGAGVQTQIPHRLLAGEIPPTPPAIMPRGAFSPDHRLPTGDR